MEYDKDKEENQEEQIDTRELQSIIKSEMDDAKDYIDQIGESRAEATEYYLGNEPEANSSLQSEFISTDVRDSILFMMPSIMRTFFGTKKVVEFIPRNVEDIPLAEQQTNYINYIIQQKNPGFKVLYDAFKDALVRKSGFVKAFWDDSISASTHEYTNLTREAYMALVMDADVEIVKEKIEMEQMKMIDRMTGEEVMQETPVSYDVTIRRVKKKNQVCIESIPPEEVLISRNARNIYEAPYVAHRMVKTVSDLVAMGYDREEIQQYAGSGSNLDADTYDEIEARNPYDDNVFDDRGSYGNKKCFIC